MMKLTFKSKISPSFPCTPTNPRVASSFILGLEKAISHQFSFLLLIFGFSFLSPAFSQQKIEFSKGPYKGLVIEDGVFNQSHKVPAVLRGQSFPNVSFDFETGKIVIRNSQKAWVRFYDNSRVYEETRFKEGVFMQPVKLGILEALSGGEKFTSYGCFAVIVIGGFFIGFFRETPWKFLSASVCILIGSIVIFVCSLLLAVFWSPTMGEMWRVVGGAIFLISGVFLLFALALKPSKPRRRRVT